MKRKRMPCSIRKFIRKEKARIRREVLDSKEQEKLISQLYQKLSKNSKDKNPKIKDKEQILKPAELVPPNIKAIIN